MNTCTYIICARTPSRLWFYISVYFTLIFLSSSQLGIFFSLIYHSQQLTWNNSEILSFKFALLVCKIKSRMSSPVASSLVKCPMSHNIWSAQFKGPAGHYDREQQTVTKDIIHLSFIYTICGLDCSGFDQEIVILSPYP